MKSIYIVGNNHKSRTGGPVGIIRGLCAALKNKVDLHELCLTEEFGKVALLKNLLKILFFKRNCVVNVHTDGLKLPKLVYFFSRFDKKNKYFLTLHGLHYVEGEIEKTYLKFSKKYLKIESKLIKKFPNIICVSELLKKKIEADFHRTKNVFVVPNGLDWDADSGVILRERNFEPPVKIIMLGGLREIKGFFECLDVVKYLNVGGIDARLDIYGSHNAELLERFNVKLQELGIEDKVTYHGNLPNKKDVYRVLSEADIQLCLSKWDTFNVAIVESLACGVPCISSDRCGAASAITEGLNGCVVRVEDENYCEKIAEFIRQLQNSDESARQRRAESAADIIEQYNWDRVTDLYLSVVGAK